MKKILFVILLLTNNVFTQGDSKYQSYIAHIAEANSSLRLNEAADSKRWLESAQIVLV